MKKFLVIVCISAFFASCNGGSSTTEAPAADTSATMSTAPAADTSAKMSTAPAADTTKMAADTTKK